MPRHGAPRRGEDRILLGVDRREIGVDIDEQQLAGEVDVGDAEGF